MKIIFCTIFEGIQQVKALSRPIASQRATESSRPLQWVRMQRWNERLIVKARTLSRDSIDFFMATFSSEKYEMNDWP